MRIDTRTLIASLACGILVVCSLAPDRGKATSAPPAEVLAKQARIEAVAADLGDRDTSALSPAQHDARLLNIERLREYANRGVFTRNDDSPDRDPAQDRAARERAVGALGLIGQRGDNAWSMDLKRGCNFMADAPALRTVLAAF